MEFKAGNNYIWVWKSDSVYDDRVYLYSDDFGSFTARNDMNVGGSDLFLFGHTKIQLEIPQTRVKIVMNAAGITFTDAQNRSITLTQIINALS